MTLKQKLITSLFVFAFAFSYSQKVSAVYRINDLLKRLNSADTVYVVNFWATWCKPCVEELPAFDSLTAYASGSKIKVLLVCLDFREKKKKKVNPFLLRKNIRSECILLDESNGNDFINKINPTWSGAIPATLFKKNKAERFFEKKMKLYDLKKQVY